MSSRMTEISIDCADPDRLADFWCGVLGYAVLDREDGLVEIGPPDRPDAELLDAVRRGPVPPTIFLARVPEAKTVKNRLHFDVSPVDGTQAEEIARIEALGATRADVGQSGDESWVVLADPEGNEFCVLRSLAPGEFDLG
ncbi:glyoxalase [Nocardioides sp. Root1257]|uniref:VOC family protein n=1 Tax=unclassified Nocardioides TaxID=2615069 RepID=UPI0006F7E6E9|nr:MULTISPECIES: VOC family protein [unclassified Nocardioides]KQW53601.1 glyoxalase [Nocardioides sp. Root1257]KRC56287.1 glyoxalase [Nocardioides sp. Root224]